MGLFNSHWLMIVTTLRGKKTPYLFDKIENK